MLFSKRYLFSGQGELKLPYNGVRLHLTHVGGFERGERNVALENIVKLGKALALSSRDLFGDLP